MARKTMIGVVGVALFALNGVSYADQLTMTLGNVWGRGVDYSYDTTAANGATTHANPEISGHTTAGRFDWTVVAPEGPVTYSGWTFNDGQTFYTFCSELTQFISPGGTYTYNSSAIEGMPSEGEIGSAMGMFRAGLLQELFDNHYSDAVNGISGTDRTEAAAFQIAVWEIVYENRLDEVGSGGTTTVADVLNAGEDTFIISGNAAVVMLADMWLNELLGATLADDRLIGFASDTEGAGGGWQDQMALMPLPAPVWLAGIGLLGVVIGRKRLRNLVAG